MASPTDDIQLVNESDLRYDLTHTHTHTHTHSLKIVTFPPGQGHGALGLSRLEQTRSCHHSRSWKSNGLVSRTAVSAAKTTTKELTMELPFPFFFLPPCFSLHRWWNPRCHSRHVPHWALPPPRAPHWK
uniref:Uncharacterized protein n=1 Tax=Pipistrellus kuhlii TaxID=59472 RepID=A0A7J7VMV2_PIPKU|nr:hypothetical protein mPipKuh1_008383 [Pipistrellus kuhlii]